MNCIYGLFKEAAPVFRLLSFRLEKAVRWIEKYKISGILSKYPLDISIYDWAITQGLFKPKRDDQKTPGFIQSFSTVHIEDSQYIDGVEEG